VAAAHALGRLGLPRAVPALVEALGPTAPTTLRVAAAQALGRVGDPSSLTALALAAGSGEHDLARTAVASLALLGRGGRARLEALVRAAGQGAVYAREALALEALHASRETGRQAA
jgi:HEAT repeat protein